MTKAVVLLSGGLDSATCLAAACAKGLNCTALSFDYGQKQVAELNAAKKLAKLFKVKHQIIDLSIGQFGGSALTDDELAIPDYDGSNEIPITYVPARNTVFLSVALSLAEAIDATEIHIGASFIDYSGYPDCRPEYFEAFNHLIGLATKKTVNGQSIKIITPLIDKSKAQTIEIGHQLGLDYSLTVSCYAMNEKGEACGRCDSCALRKKGFLEAKVADPTIYA